MLMALVPLSGPPVQAQEAGYCPSTGAVTITYQGMEFYGTAAREPERWYEGWFDDTYAFRATEPITGNWITGHFALSEFSCYLARESGGWATTTQVKVETYNDVGGGGYIGYDDSGYEWPEMGLRDTPVDSHGNCTSIMYCLGQQAE